MKCFLVKNSTFCKLSGESNGYRLTPYQHFGAFLNALYNKQLRNIRAMFVTPNHAYQAIKLFCGHQTYYKYTKLIISEAQI